MAVVTMFVCNLIGFICGAIALAFGSGFPVAFYLWLCVSLGGSVMIFLIVPLLRKSSPSRRQKSSKETQLRSSSRN